MRNEDAMSRAANIAIPSEIDIAVHVRAALMRRRNDLLSGVCSEWQRKPISLI